MTDQMPAIVSYAQPEVMQPIPEKRTVTKRDGSKEPFDASKLVKWSLWGKERIEHPIAWQDAVREVSEEAQDGISTAELQEMLITHFLRKGTWANNRMAGILYAPTQHKKIFPNGIPTVKELHVELAKRGLMRELKYSDEEYAEIEKIVDHDHDFNYAHFQIKHIIQKYSLVDHDTKQRFETPQFTYIRMAMALSEDIVPAERRMTFVKDYYELFSDNVLNAPTPNYIYLGTKLNGLVSCCLITNKDTIKSLSAFNYIAYRVTAIGAGVGGLLRSRNHGEKVRGGAILHNGKLPYFKAVAGDVKANMQSGRAGAFTGYYNIFDAEANQIAQLQNPRTPPNRRNRDMHFAVQYHSLFMKKAALDEEVFIFSCKTAPDLFEAFYGSDRKAFAKLYEKYENDPSFKKTYISARDLLVVCEQQSREVGTHYSFNSDVANYQTPYLEPIYSSNLCAEVMQPSNGYDDVQQLYHDGYFGKSKLLVRKADQLIEVELEQDEVITYHHDDGSKLSIKVGDLNPGMTFNLNHFTPTIDEGVKVTVEKVISWDRQPETSFCSLAGIVLPNIKDDAHYDKAMYYALRMIDYCIHKSSYPMPQLAFTAKKRLNAAVGVLGVATVLARKGAYPGTQECWKITHELAERHMYYAVKNSIKIGKELGNAPWMYKTKWAQGWLPTDSYAKGVDEVIPHFTKYDQEGLRKELIENKGMRFSSLMAHMPTESSAKAAGVPNGLYWVRDLSMGKSDATNTIDWVATDSDQLKNKYHSAWQIDPFTMIDYYSIWQKHTDQGISCDGYTDRVANPELLASDLVLIAIHRFNRGIKSWYYQNSMTSSDGLSGFNEPASCSSNGCTL